MAIVKKRLALSASLCEILQLVNAIICERIPRAPHCSVAFLLQQRKAEIYNAPRIQVKHTRFQKQNNSRVSTFHR